MGAVGSQMGFMFVVTPTLIAQGLTYALILGLVGGLMPCLHAARMPITRGLAAA